MKWEELGIKKYFLVRQELKNTEKSPTDQTISILAILKDKEEEEIANMHIQEVLSEVAKLNTLLSETPQFADCTHFEFKGETYYIKSLADDSFGAYAAYESILAKYPVDDYRQTTYALAILARKKDEKFDSYKVSERAAMFEELPTPVALGVSSFFLHKEKSLRNVMLISMEIQRRVSALPKNLSKRLFRKGGDGTPQPTHLLLSWMMWRLFCKKVHQRFLYISHALQTIMRCKSKSKKSELN